MSEIKCGEFTVDALFDLCAVLDKIGLDQILNAFGRREINSMKEAGMQDLGTAVASKVAGIIVANMQKAEPEICLFFAHCTVRDDGKKVTPDDIKKMSIFKLVQLIQDFCHQEDIQDFFRGVAKFAVTEPETSSSSSITDTATEPKTT